MSDDEARIVEAIRDLLDCNRSAPHVLLESDKLLEGAIEQLLAGQRVVDILHASPVSSQRRATQETLDRVNSARRNLRNKVIEVCLEEGMLPGQIAEVWGVSRQRIDQHVQVIKRSSMYGASES